MELLNMVPKFVKVLLLFVLIVQSDAQGKGRGISKRTWASANPIKCYDWFSKYLPVENEHSNCPDLHYCTCATQGRVHTTRDNGLDGFGIHTINCTQHPYGDIGLPEMEEIIQAKYGDFSKYDAFMDDNMGFWSNDLDPFILAFLADGIQFMPLKWYSGGKQYYSILTNPCGFVLIELMSDTMSLLDPETMTLGRQRMTFENWNNNIESGNRLTPLRVSRSISKPELVDTFWKEILKSEEIFQFDYDDGVTVREIIPPHSTVHVQFWSGRPTSGDFTIDDFEKYVNSVHDDVMINGVCGFDQWVDNHIAIDGRGAPSLSEIAELFEQNGFHYHWWKTPGAYQIYAADESGWGVQFDLPPGNPPSNVPTYSAACASNDGCLGQGNCKADFYRRVFNL